MSKTLILGIDTNSTLFIGFQPTTYVKSYLVMLWSRERERQQNVLDFDCAQSTYKHWQELIFWLEKKFIQVIAQWAKTGKIVHFGRTMHCFPQGLKLMFFEKFSSGGSLKGTRSEDKLSKNVDYCLWGNHTITQTYLKLDFFCVLAHCVLGGSNKILLSLICPH